MAKLLYEFVVEKEVEKEIKTENPNPDGSGTMIVSVEKVKTKEPHKFALKKPNRIMFDEADLHFGVSLAELIRAGLLTRNMLGNKYDNDGGTFSKPDLEIIEGLLREMLDLENQYKEKTAALEGDKENEALKKETEDIAMKLVGIRRELLRYQSKQDSIYNETAEVKARNKTILWWILMLALKGDDKGGYAPFFEGEGLDKEAFDRKLKSYDEYEERDDEFEMRVIRYFTYLVSFWYRNADTTKEQFDELVKDLDGGLE